MDELPLGGAPRDRRRRRRRTRWAAPSPTRRTSSPPPTTTTSRRLTTLRSTSCERDRDTGRAKERPDPSMLTSYSPRASPVSRTCPVASSGRRSVCPSGKRTTTSPPTRRSKSASRTATRAEKNRARTTTRGRRAGVKRCWLRWTTFAPWARTSWTVYESARRRHSPRGVTTALTAGSQVTRPLCRTGRDPSLPRTTTSGASPWPSSLPAGSVRTRRTGASRTTVGVAPTQRAKRRRRPGATVRGGMRRRARSSDAAPGPLARPGRHGDAAARVADVPPAVQDEDDARGDRADLEHTGRARDADAAGAGPRTAAASATAATRPADVRAGRADVIARSPGGGRGGRGGRAGPAR